MYNSSLISSLIFVDKWAMIRKICAKNPSAGGRRREFALAISSRVSKESRGQWETFKSRLAHQTKTRGFYLSFFVFGSKIGDTISSFVFFTSRWRQETVLCAIQQVNNLAFDEVLWKNCNIYSEIIANTMIFHYNKIILYELWHQRDCGNCSTGEPESIRSWDHER